MGILLGITTIPDLLPNWNFEFVDDVARLISCLYRRHFKKNIFYVGFLFLYRHFGSVWFELGWLRKIVALDRSATKNWNFLIFAFETEKKWHGIWLIQKLGQDRITDLKSTKLNPIGSPQWVLGLSILLLSLEGDGVEPGTDPIKILQRKFYALQFF